ncbi:hypothetical protein LZL87_003724 [Fusarium oxysporum]|nr:hypothetical protein LZL87_003724 [Fusarium oxysporum]
MATPANQAVAQDAETIEDLGPWTVVPGGDVMLVVGANKVQILASASFLSHVSAMFEKMFSGGMKEGNSLVNRVDGQPTRIELPDDNPEAVYHGIQILYESNPGSFTLPPEPSEIYLSFQTKQTWYIVSSLSAPSGWKQHRAGHSRQVRSSSRVRPACRVVLV